MLGPVETYKSRVRRAFSRHAGTYDLHAEIQDRAAQLSASMIAAVKTRTAVPEGDILEVGCGTGLFSSKLLGLFPHRQIICSDISTDMLAACRFRLGSQCARTGSLHFQNLDAEELCPEPKYAVIASSFAIQWFFQPLQGMSRLISALKPGGLLFFSVPGNDSCSLWRSCAEKIDIPFTRNPMPTMEDLQKLAVRSGLEFHLQDQFIETSYKDGASMLRALKELGAATQRDGRRLNCLQLRKLLRELDKSGKPLRDSYQIITGHFRRMHA